MKIHPVVLPLLIAALSGSILTGCATRKPQPAVTVASTGSAKQDGKSYKGVAKDDLDEYTSAPVSDPMEHMNRGTFWFNAQVYNYLARPISWTYDKVVPGPLRTGIYNAFDNVDYPIRVINDALQGNLPRVGLETEKFVVNSVAGVGGLVKVSDHIPAIANVPAGDTGQTFAKWGIGYGAYFVIPLLGPNDLRDTVGLVGDYGLNPVTWVTIVYGGVPWIAAISGTDALRTLHNRLAIYDSATKNAMDPYLAARTAYLQYRKEKAAQ